MGGSPVRGIKGSRRIPETQSVERRSSQRIRRRAECTIRRGRESHEGTILDISEGGLAAICELPLEQGSVMTIEFSGLRRPLEVKAVVWHCRAVRYRGVESFAHGFMLDHAPPDYQRLLSSSQRPSGPQKAPAAETPKPEPEPASASEQEHLEDLRSELGEALKESRKASPEPAFRVRAKQRNRPRTKTLSLTAADEEGVREAVRASLGDEWEILEVIPAA